MSARVSAVVLRDSVKVCGSWRSQLGAEFVMRASDVGVVVVDGPGYVLIPWSNVRWAEMPGG
jgi:hypothetical protein